MRVTDGDTIVVLGHSDAQYKVRLTGIDAPEGGQAFGTKSKEHLSDSVAGRFVVVEYEKRDRYERVLGKVLLSGEDMNPEQIRAGMAWHYKQYQDEQTPVDREFYTLRQRSKPGRLNVGCGTTLSQFLRGNIET